MIMINCLQCSAAFPEEDPEKIRRVCNNPDPSSQHYLCVDCIKAYEDVCMTKYLEKNFFSQRTYSNHLEATYALTKCPCPDCPYSFYPVRDGPTRLHRTDSPNARLYKLTCIHPQNISYLGDTSINNHKGECRSYEIANYKEGRLHGKYVILQMMRDLDKHVIQDYSYYPFNLTINKPTILLGVLEFQNGFLKGVDQYISFKYRVIRELIETIEQSQSQSPTTLLDLLWGAQSSRESSPEKIYELLVGTPEITASNGFIIMSHHRYGEYNNLEHMTHYIMGYNGLKIKEFPSNDNGNDPLPYHSAKMHIADFKLYLSPKIQEKFPTTAYLDFPFDVTLTYDHVLKQTTYYGMFLKKFNDPKKNILKTFIQSNSTFFLIPTEDGSKTRYDVSTYKRYYHETGQLHHIYQLKCGGNPASSPKKWGEDILYHPNGQLNRLIHYENGKPSGYIYYYSSNGTITSIVHYQDGVKSILYQKS